MAKFTSILPGKFLESKSTGKNIPPGWLAGFLLTLKKPGKTMIIATHNHEFARVIADRIVFINWDYCMDHICGGKKIYKITFRMYLL